ncbi:3-hydroxyanthranilate 3,4-dioxygenase-like [Ylistrum balloti]|uniref:3-hydroxyanthranilate 3,4-dioxygenase-like n=1 Tax=Ylistrum balloti TaxID=509963 RepID=UPI0029058A9F|nr:3-hydroxyanthranilate 3,4-dioxygenase-like [Ylistrum balloti]
MTTTTVNAPVHYNTDKWIEENQKFFLPPVCNKMMHNEGQMKLFYVGGPNQRKDYHIEEGEELFYMIKGDMCLKVVEHNKHRDIHIKEGQIFLLPSRVAHSPQRQSDTIGMVIERERDQKEMDGLRYYIEKDGASTLESLYEEWFHCEDLGVQLAPIIKKYFASEEFKTGRPTGTIPDPPFNLDATVELEEPFSLKDWIDRNREELDGKGMVNMFGKDRQFEVNVYGKGENTGKCDNAEIFIWQLEGNSTANVDGKEFHLTCNDSLLVPIGKSYTSKRGTGSVALICFQDPTRKDVRQ